ncbi:hypothetical protein FE257_008405 [Aspergillus nanangensis]|uniref:BYS1 domain protein n=1 Tax=Aspergillus nanangensis TaxID=2582783 RepID=A0AAD4CN67_ASPNN|nr:hypothetical protein FE257_008405 [Aspergillus nanangensis]
MNWLYTLALTPLALTNAMRLANTTGNAIVVNNCPHHIYLWSVASEVMPQTTIAPTGNYTETFRRDARTGGVSIKVSTAKDGLYNSKPLTVFAYNLEGTTVWYDLSDVFGDPFKGHRVTLGPENQDVIVWEDGVPPAGSQVRVHNAGDDLHLSLCDSV